MEISYGKPVIVHMHPGTYTTKDGHKYQFTVYVDVNDWGNMQITDVKWTGIEPLESSLIEDEIKDKFFDIQRD